MALYAVSSVSYSTGGIFLFDSITGRRERLLKGRFRGLTRGPDGRLYTVTGCRRQHHSVDTHIFRVRPESGEAEDLGVVPWKACHDLRWIDGSFYLVASIGNAIVRLDERFRELDRMQIVEHEEDVCHVNCLARAAGGLYATAFTLTPGTRSEKRLTRDWSVDGKVLRLDYDRKRFTVCCEPLAQPHSLTWHGNRLFLLESHTSRLTRVDPLNGRAERLVQLAGFLRGMAFGTGEVVLGVCQMFLDERRSARTVPLAARLRDRFRPFTGLLMLDPDTWKVRRRFHWPGIEVYDILGLE